MSINAFLFSSFNQSSASTFAIFTENGSAICVSYASRKCFTVIGLWSVGWCDGCLWPAHTMRRQLDRFDLRIGQTTIALVKSTDDDRLSCAHTMRFSSFRLLCVQQKTKIAWCEPGFRVGRYALSVQAQLGKGKPCRSRKELNMSRVNRLQCTDRKRQGDYEWFGPKELTIIRNGQVIVMDR